MDCCNSETPYFIAASHVSVLKSKVWSEVKYVVQNLLKTIPSSSPIRDLLLCSKERIQSISDFFELLII